MEFRVVVGTLLVDEHGVYGPRLTNDRLLHVITHNANMLGERVQGCISFGAPRVDEAVCEEVLRRLQPLGIEAALKAIEAQERVGDDVHRHVELALDQARYEASL